MTLPWYATRMDSIPPEELPEEWVWERLRMRRDQFLRDTDWRVVTDAAWDVIPWVDYRQQLRDLPQATSDPRTVDWPEVPE